MLNLGVIGLGPVWDSYQSALTQLRHPLKVVAVFDPHPSRAATKAKELRAVSVSGITALALRPEVQAVLLTDPDWAGAAVLDLLAQANKPVFVAPWLPCTASSAATWYAATENHGVTLMPAMWRRFMPATIRIKELLATELGEPLEIHLPLECASLADPADVTEAIVGWLDLIWYLVRREPVFETQAPTSNGHDWTIQFPPRQPHPIEGASAQASRVCRLHIHWTGPTDADSIRHLIQQGTAPMASVCERLNFEQNFVPRIELRCERGSATIQDRTTISCRRSDSVEHSEQLTSERPERIVLLDHFSRRAVGGLIPVADFNDIHRILRLVGP